MTVKTMHGRALRSVQWRQMTMGGRMGSPFAEWAYFTDEFPQGVPQSELSLLPEDAQKRVALFWLYSNFEAFEPRNWGEYFGFAGSGGAGFDRGSFRPSFYAPGQLLTEEFANFLPENAIRAIADALPKRWLWKPETLPPANTESLQQSIQAATEKAGAALSVYEETLHRAHNNPPELIDGSALSPKEVAELREALEFFRTIRDQPSKAQETVAKGALQTVEHKRSRLQSFKDKAETAAISAIICKAAEMLWEALNYLVHTVHTWLYGWPF